MQRAEDYHRGKTTGEANIYLFIFNTEMFQCKRRWTVQDDPVVLAGKMKGFLAFVIQWPTSCVLIKHCKIQDFLSEFSRIQRGMETPLDVLSRAASLLHADDEKRKSETWFSLLDPNALCLYCASV